MDFKWNKSVAPVEPSLTPRELPKVLSTEQVLGQHGGATDAEYTGTHVPGLNERVTASTPASRCINNPKGLPNHKGR